MPTTEETTERPTEPVETPVTESPPALESPIAPPEVIEEPPQSTEPIPEPEPVVEAPQPVPSAPEAPPDPVAPLTENPPPPSPEPPKQAEPAPPSVPEEPKPVAEPTPVVAPTPPLVEQGGVPAAVLALTDNELKIAAAYYLRKNQQAIAQKGVAARQQTMNERLDKIASHVQRGTNKLQRIAKLTNLSPGLTAHYLQILTKQGRIKADGHGTTRRYFV